MVSSSPGDLGFLGEQLGNCLQPFLLFGARTLGVPSSALRLKHHMFWPQPSHLAIGEPYPSLWHQVGASEILAGDFDNPHLLPSSLRYSWVLHPFWPFLECSPFAQSLNKTLRIWLFSPEQGN